MTLVAVTNRTGRGELINIQGLPADMSYDALGLFLALTHCFGSLRCTILDGESEHADTMSVHCAVYEWVTEPKPCLRLVSPRS